MAAKPSLFELLRSLADDLSTEKTAAVKRAENPEQGQTSHPSSKADDGTVDATEGARAAENTADVKKDVGGLSVDSSDTVPRGTAKDDMPQIGTNATPTGEDPAVEDNYKANADDPGTTHPARADTNEKYGSCSFEESYQKAIELSNAILADLAVGFGNQLAPQTKTAAQAAESVANALQQDPAAAQEFQAGYALAAQLGLTKEAAEQVVAETIAQARRDGEFDADLYGMYVTSLLKQAAGMRDVAEAQEGEDHNKPGDAQSGAAEAGATPGGTGPSDEELLQAMSAMQGPPGEAGAPEAGGGPSEEEALNELVAALDELGISPDELAAAVSEAEGGATPPAEAPAAPPVENEGLKLAQAVKAYKRSGRYQIKEAKTPQQRQFRDLLKAHVLEILKG